MPNLSTLPDDLLISICQLLQLPDLFALRLCSRSLATCIQCYASSIAPLVARNTFPGHTLLLRPPSPPPDANSGGTGYDLRWLRSLFPKYLASVLVERRGRKLFYFDFPAENPLGDDARKIVQRGVCVLAGLSRIAQAVHNLSDADLPASIAPVLATDSSWAEDPELELVLRRESLVMERRLGYVQALSWDDLLGYRLALRMLGRIVEIPKPRSFISRVVTSNLYFNWGEGGEAVTEGISWFNWFVMHYGPDILWQQWWCLEGQTVVGAALGAWQARSLSSTRGQIWIEKEAAYQVHRAIEKQYRCDERSGGVPFNSFRVDEEVFKQYMAFRMGVLTPKQPPGMLYRDPHYAIVFPD